MQAEVAGLAAASRLPLKFVQSIQMLYELQTLMVPIVNFTGEALDVLPAGFEELARIPWRGPGCTGIIAKGSDGTVYHARNLDFSPVQFMTDLVCPSLRQCRTPTIIAFTISITSSSCRT